MLRAVLLLALAVVGLAACRTLDVPPNPLTGVAWELRALASGSDSLTTDDGLPADRLVFQDDSGVRAASCNSCVGNYVVSDLHIVIRGLACTRRACPENRLELDRYVAGRMAYRRTGDRLILDIDDDINGIEARLYFDAVPLPPDADSTN